MKKISELEGYKNFPSDTLREKKYTIEKR